MCGVVGWLCRGEGPGVDQTVLARMRDRLVHRGPDGEGLWIGNDGRVGLAFRRLAIVDLSEAANQPMTNEDGSVHVVFNGEIYNHAALRHQLEGYGHQFRTDHADTEVIVHGYEQWGVDVVSRLDGMFAIGLWDQTRRRLLLVRDRVGVKPLYFCRTRGAMLFASEIKALVAHPDVSPAMDPHAAYHYLSFMASPAPLTLFRGIYKLPAGWRLEIDGQSGTVTPVRYWDADASDEALAIGRRPHDRARPAAIAAIGSLLDRAVAKRLMSDVPFGVLLSGGIDSTAITALVKRHARGAVRTFTVGFTDDQGLNELDEAGAVARHFGTEHHEVRIDEAAMRAYVPDLIVTQDEPLADWVCIPLYFVSRLVRDSGTVVTLVGEGADEQFCGYRSYLGYLRLHDRYWRVARRLPAAARRLAWRAAEAIGVARPDLGLYTDIVRRVAADESVFWGGAIALWESQKRALLERAPAPAEPPDWLHGLLPSPWLRADTHGIVTEHLRALGAQANRLDTDQLDRMAYLEFKQRLPELLLMRVDKVTMSTSVEARVPFLDPALVRFTMGLPQALKVPGGRRKDLLKAACRGLIPDWVIDRQKKGFGAPMAYWLRGDFGRDVEAQIQASRLVTDGVLSRQRIGQLFEAHRRGRDTSVPLWTVYNLTAWHERWCR